jgi:glucose-1-phosphate cytidylyltransferase
MEKPQVVILCGGKGNRLSEETAIKPKPMVEIGGRPILWHIMKIYSYYGYNRFILALGYLGEHIKRYFYEYRLMSGDLTLEMNPDSPPQLHSIPEHNDWEITLIDTGPDTLKGGRIKRLEKYITSENFHLTYGDGVADIDIDKLYNFHLSHGKTGTVSVVRPPSRFGELLLSGDNVVEFEEKPQLATGSINGGFFVFKKEFLQYLTPDEDCDFEFGALQKLAKEGQLYAYKHDGFWQCMDNRREKDYLNQLWEAEKAEWKIWE